jgi:hypothetical protein
MLLEFARYRLPLWCRITAGAAILLTLALVVLAGSPRAHAWMHAHEHDGVAGQAAPSDVVVDLTGDACVVALFTTGVLLAAVLFLLAGAFRPAVSFSLRPVAVVCRTVPRYWLPPLCGPPLS